jgi:cell division protein FtsL
LNNFNIFIIIASITIVGLFLGAVFINLNVKNDKIAIEKINDQIAELKLDLKRQKVQIATLTNPFKVLKYADDNNLKPISIKRKHTIYVDKN